MGQYPREYRRSPASEIERQAIRDRVAREDAENMANAQGWDRLRGMLTPIGRPSAN